MYTWPEVYIVCIKSVLSLGNVGWDCAYGFSCSAWMLCLSEQLKPVLDTQRALSCLLNIVKVEKFSLFSKVDMLKVNVLKCSQDSKKNEVALVWKKEKFWSSLTIVTDNWRNS